MEPIASLKMRAEAPISSATDRHSPGKYRPEIDGLRAFAVVAVIINHINQDILPSGYLGVDIFFVMLSPPLWPVENPEVLRILLWVSTRDGSADSCLPW
jgi:hypothetical protein